MNNIEKVRAPLPTPVYPVEYEGSLTQTEAMGQFQYKLNEVIDSQNQIIEHVGDLEVVQSTGNSTKTVMSQNATTTALYSKIAKSDINQTTGDNPSTVMSQRSVTNELNTKASKYPTNVTFTVTGNNVTYTADFNSLKSLINSREGKFIINSPKNKNGLLTASYMDDNTIALTTTLITSEGESYLEEVVIKSDSQRGSYIAIPYNMSTSNTFFYSPNNDGNYQCNKTYTEIADEHREVGRRYRFYNGDLTKQNCELVLCDFGGDVKQFYFEGIYSSDTITDTTGKKILAQTIVRITINNMNQVNVILNTTGVDDSQATTKSSTTYSPSNRYVNENFVEYADLENNLIYADPEKAPSMDLISQNFVPLNFTKSELSHDPIISDADAPAYATASLNFLPDNAIAVEFDVSFIGSGELSNINLWVNLWGVLDSKKAIIYNNDYPAHCKITARNVVIPTVPQTTGAICSYEILGTDASAAGTFRTPRGQNPKINQMTVLANSESTASRKIILYNIRYWTE